MIFFLTSKEMIFFLTISTLPSLCLPSLTNCTRRQLYDPLAHPLCSNMPTIQYLPTTPNFPPSNLPLCFAHESGIGINMCWTLSKLNLASYNNLGDRIFRLVGCSGTLETLTLTPNRSPNGGKKLAINAAAPRFASNQDIYQLRTTIPKCRPRYAFFKSKTPVKILPPRLLNLL